MGNAHLRSEGTTIQGCSAQSWDEKRRSGSREGAGHQGKRPTNAVGLKQLSAHVWIVFFIETTYKPKPTKKKKLYFSRLRNPRYLMSKMNVGTDRGA